MPQSPPSTVLSIRNMVCDRCVRVVREELTKLGLDVRRVELGEAEVAPGPSPVDLPAIGKMLELNGFELIQNRRKKLIEDVRLAIIRVIHSGQPLPERFTLSRYVSREVREPYQSLTTLFSSVEGTTIEHFFILQKVERVKELLKYGGSPLKQIAWDLGYSSTQHLSNQFKQITGMTPTEFRKLGVGKRIPLDRVHPRHR